MGLRGRHARIHRWRSLEYDDRIWSARYAIAAMPIVANGIDLDWAFSRANGQNWEFELRKGPLRSAC